MLNSYPDVLTINQLAEILCIGKNKAYELIRNGTIKSRRFGRSIRIPKVCLLDYLNSTRYTKTMIADNLTAMKGETNDR